MPKLKIKSIYKKIFVLLFLFLLTVAQAFSTIHLFSHSFENKSHEIPENYSQKSFAKEKIEYGKEIKNSCQLCLLAHEHKRVLFMALGFLLTTLLGYAFKKQIFQYLKSSEKPHSKLPRAPPFVLV